MITNDKYTREASRAMDGVPLDEDYSESESESDSGMEIDEDNVIHRFFSSTNQGMLLVAVGKSERGKSYFIRWLLRLHFTSNDPFHFGLAVVKSKYTDSYPMLPRKYIMDGYQKNRESLMTYFHNLDQIRQELGYVPKNFLILDDQIGMLNNKDPWFENLMATFRHYNTYIFIGVQYLQGKSAISPLMREQTNVAIMFNSRTRRTLENLYETYGGLFDKYEDFKDYMHENTAKEINGKYQCIVYFENIDSVEDNYIPMRAPVEIPLHIEY